jgi:hypothetical protein
MIVGPPNHALYEISRAQAHLSASSVDPCDTGLPRSELEKDPEFEGRA